MNARVAPHITSISASAWVRAGVIWFARTHLQTPSALFSDDVLRTSWSANFPFANTGDELCSDLAKVTLNELECSQAFKRYAQTNQLSSADVFICLLCAAMENDYWLNLAVQELQGVSGSTFPKLHFLCDLIAALWHEPSLRTEPIAWREPITPAAVAQRPYVLDGLLVLQEQGPLALSHLRVNIQLWDLLEKREKVAPLVRTLVRRESNKELPPLFNAVATQPYQNDRCVLVDETDLLGEQHTALDHFAVALRTKKIRHLHLYGAYSRALSFVCALSQRLHKTAVIPEKVLQDNPRTLSTLSQAYQWLPVLEANAQEWKALGEIECVVIHRDQTLLLDAATHAQNSAVYCLPKADLDERKLAWQRWVGESLADNLARQWLVDAANVHALMSHLPQAKREASDGEMRNMIASWRRRSAPDHLQNLAFLQTNEIEESGIVLNQKLRDELQRLIERCQQRESLYSDLGSSLVNHPNCGVKAVFSGESGTGKSLAALYVATQLGIPIYRLDLGAVLNKYVGETEKNIHKLLEQAAAEDFIVLIDEADALFGKRTDADSGGERFANMLTNYLLARIEQHKGIVLMTTNGLARMDSAFLRRLDCVVEFQAPDLEERASIWQSHLGERSPGAAICRQLASLCEVSGGYIRNAVLAAAAEMSVEQSSVLPFGLLLTMIAQEYRKSGRPLPPKLNQQLASVAR